jgi:hypothetical protein
VQFVCGNLLLPIPSSSPQWLDLPRLSGTCSGSFVSRTALPPLWKNRKGHPTCGCISKGLFVSFLFWGGLFTLLSCHIYGKFIAGMATCRFCQRHVLHNSHQSPANMVHNLARPHHFQTGPASLGNCTTTRVALCGTTLPSALLVALHEQYGVSLVEPQCHQPGAPDQHIADSPCRHHHW